MLRSVDHGSKTAPAEALQPAMIKQQPNESPTVRDLQQQAASAAKNVQRRKRDGKNRLSRSARLNLIDILSRWGGPGLAFIAGIAIFIGVTSGRTHPVGASIWLLIMLASLYVCRRLRKRFRAGEKIASRPFRWRANYTSALAVLSAAFGAGAFLVLPSSADPVTSLQVSALILLGAIGAGVLHIAHGRTVSAIVAPASIFVIAAVWQSNGASVAIFGAAALVAAASVFLFLASRQLQAKSASRFPRTGFVRRGAEGRDALAPAITHSQKVKIS